MLTRQSIVICSRPVFLLVGTEKQLIAVPQDLLNLHLAFFRNMPATFVVDNTISVSKIKPIQFANCMVWLQTVAVSPEINPKILPNEKSITLEEDSIWDENWKARFFETTDAIDKLWKEQILK